MRSLMITTVVLFAGLGFVAVPSPAQQEGPPAPPRPPSGPTEAERKFDTLVRQAARVLAATQAYSVEAVCDWKTAGNGPERTGRNTLHIVAAGPTKVRLEASSPRNGADGELLVVADGKTLTRLLTGRKLFSQTPSSKPLDDLQHDALTRQALRGAGLDFLLKTDLIGHVMTQTVKVVDLGLVESAGQKLQAFRLGMADGREIEVRLTTGDRPVPVEMHTTVRVPLGENKTFELNLNARLKWNLDAKPDANTFVANPPEGSRKVNDLTDALLDSDVTALLGKPAPALTLAHLDGSKADLSAYQGKILVLYFWATWAAPSIQDMPGLNQFVQTYSEKGVNIVGVAVGEKSADVTRFAEKQGYQGKLLLDPKADALATLKTNALPTVLVIGKDGTLQAYYRGARPNLREQLRQDLDRLLKGERLVP